VTSENASGCMFVYALMEIPAGNFVSHSYKLLSTICQSVILFNVAKATHCCYKDHKSKCSGETVSMIVPGTSNGMRLHFESLLECEHRWWGGNVWRLYLPSTRELCLYDSGVV